MPKICPVCHECKDLTEFYKNRTRQDGYASECKTCATVHNATDKGRARFRRYNAKRIRRAPTKKRVYKPRKRPYTPAKAAYQRAYRQRPAVRARRILEKRAYERLEHVREKARVRCRIRYWRDHSHKLAIARLRRARCPDKFQEYRHRRRARISGAPVNDLTNKQWEMIKELFRHRCAYCRKISKRLTKDHIIPLANQGAHTFSNIVPACSSCNSKKGKGPPLVPVQPLLLLPA